MTDSDVLDQKAVASASQYMGWIAWPTVILGLVVTAAYLATVAMALTGALSLWIAVPVVAALTYASYTVAHDSIHGSISGNSKSLRWINKALGYMAVAVPELPFHSSLVSACAVLPVRETLQRDRGSYGGKGRTGLSLNGARFEASLNRESNSVMRRNSMQSFTGFLPEHMAIVGGELAHVREAPTGSNFHDSC